MLKPLRTPTAASVLSLLLLLGCLLPTKQKAESFYGRGPTFEIPASSPSVRSTPIPVTINDERPRWEKTYYPGSNLLHRHDYAVTFVPLENFEPTFQSRLREEIQDRVSALPQLPSSVEIRITSFQVVFDERTQQEDRYQTQVAKKERERREAEAEEERQEAERKRMFPNDPANKTRDKSDQSVGKQIAGEVFGFFFGALFRGMAEGTGRAIKESRHGELHLAAPPKEIRDYSYRGLTCEIDALVVLHWANGRTSQTPLKGISSLFPRPDGYSGEDIPLVVVQSLRDLGSQLAKNTQ